MNAKETVTAKGMTSKRKQDEGTSHNPDRKKEARSIGHATDRKKKPPGLKVKVTSIANFTKTTDIALTCRHLKDQVEILIH